jgi:asparagine synthetase B (glutamine-hydrolysing)
MKRGTVFNVFSKRLQGNFSFVIYDCVAGRIVAGRDAAGAEPLFWGRPILSPGLWISSDAALLKVSCTAVEPFPAGAVFVSRPGEVEGSLTALPARWAAADQEPEDASSAGGGRAICRAESANNLEALGGMHRVASFSHVHVN